MSTSHPRRFVFALTQDFSLLSYACAVETLRLANFTTGKELYAWKIAAEDGVRAQCSGGQEIMADMGFGDVDRDETLIIVTGVNVHAA
ncbi:MAG: GlxA family transcriptional regulator, partial [Pseudomonadota bacterium]